MVSRELEDNLLSGQTTVDGAESIELVLQGGGVLGIKEAILREEKKDNMNIGEKVETKIQ